MLRQFVASYPNDAAGVVLIDSAHLNREVSMSSEFFQLTQEALPSVFLKFANQVGLLRLLFENAFPQEPEFDYHNKMYPTLLYKSANAILEEQENMTAINKGAAQITSFGNIPITVVTAFDLTRYDNLFGDETMKQEMLLAWQNMQHDLLSLSTQSEQVLVDKTGHYINEDKPEVLVEVIRKMINKTRNTN